MRTEIYYWMIHGIHGHTFISVYCCIQLEVIHDTVLDVVGCASCILCVAYCLVTHLLNTLLLTWVSLKKFLEAELRSVCSSFKLAKSPVI